MPQSLKENVTPLSWARGARTAMADVLGTPRGRRNLAVTGAAVTASAVAGSLATDPNSLWYKRLDKPAWQPPALAFPVVWTGLYASIAATSASTVTQMQQQGRTRDERAYWTSLGLNLALNSAWSYVFFRSHRPAVSAAVAAALAASCADLARRAGTVSDGHRAALVPYTVWSTFATALSAEISRRNGR